MSLNQLQGFLCALRTYCNHFLQCPLSPGPHPSSSGSAHHLCPATCSCSPHRSTGCAYGTELVELRPVMGIPGCDLPASNCDVLQSHCISASQQHLQAVLWPLGQLFLSIQPTWASLGFQLTGSQLSSYILPRHSHSSASLTSLREFVTWESVSSGSLSDTPCTLRDPLSFLQGRFSRGGMTLHWRVVRTVTECWSGHGQEDGKEYVGFFFFARDRNHFLLILPGWLVI